MIKGIEMTVTVMNTSDMKKILTGAREGAILMRNS